MGRVPGVIGVLLAAILAAQAVIAAVSWAPEGCARACDGAGAEDCAPFCGDCDGCAECFRPLGIVAVPMLPPAAPAPSVLLPIGEPEPTSAEPGDILVVPRSA